MSRRQAGEMTPMAYRDRLVARLRKVGFHIPDDATLHRAAGAWSWYMLADGRELFASQYSVGHLLRFDDWEFGPDTGGEPTEIYPAPNARAR